MTTDTPLQVRMLAALDRMEAAPGTARAAAIERMRGWLSLHATHSACEVYRALRRYRPITIEPSTARAIREVKWEAWEEAIGLAKLSRAREQDAGATLFQEVK